MPKAESPKMTTTRAAMKQAQDSPRNRPRRISSSSINDSLAAVSDEAKPEIVTHSTKSKARTNGKRPRTVRFGDKLPSGQSSNGEPSSGQPSSGEPSRVTTPEPMTATQPDTPGGMWKRDYWFWILFVTIPCNMPGRLRLIEAFDALYAGQPRFPVFRPDCPWTDPFFELVFLACEVFLPYKPFGDARSSGMVKTIGDEKLSRNATIAKIMNLAIPGKKFTMKQISSHMQTVSKRLLARYNSTRLLPDFRINAGLALMNLAQDDPPEEFYSSNVVTPENTSAEKIKVRSNGLITDERLQVAAYDPPAYEEKKTPPLHPIIAFLLNRNGRHLDEASTDFVDCSKPRPPIIGRTYAQIWWYEFVIVEPEDKIRFGRNFWNARLENNGDLMPSEVEPLQEFHYAAVARRRPELDALIAKYW